MARMELSEFAEAGIGQAAAAADTMFELGMMYSSGRTGAIDLVTAHKWFNIAAMKGHTEAARLRREISGEMSDAEIGQAQRAARDWLRVHPEPIPQAAPSFRVAA
jgi:TPR repeat protein